MNAAVARAVPAPASNDRPPRSEKASGAATDLADLLQRRVLTFRETTEDDLKRQLLKVPEIAIDPKLRAFLSTADPADFGDEDPLPSLLGNFRELLNVPFRFDRTARSSEDESKLADSLSRDLRALLKKQDQIDLRQMLLKDPRWSRPEAVATLTQLLGTERKGARMLLVELLSRIDQISAVRALAHRVLYDTNSDVRRAALEALESRPREQYLDTFVDAFRHPWPPVADHAATALVMIRAKEVESRLAALLDLPDPAAPVRTTIAGEPILVTTELVRVNHQKNCLFCHPRSTSPSDPMRTIVPESNSTSGYRASGLGTFIRADIVYLRQDFSVQHPSGDLTSLHQRFDYILRSRPATSAAEKATTASDLATYPQMDALRFTLHGLGSVRR